MPNQKKKRGPKPLRLKITGASWEDVAGALARKPRPTDWNAPKRREKKKG